MPKSTHDRIEPTMPTWRFWLLTLIGFPVAGVALALAVSAAGPQFALAALAVLALEGKLLTYERNIRRMSKRRRAFWVVVGCVTTAAVAALGASVLFFILLVEHCAEGC